MNSIDVWILKLDWVSRKIFGEKLYHGGKAFSNAPLVSYRTRTEILSGSNCSGKRIYSFFSFSIICNILLRFYWNQILVKVLSVINWWKLFYFLYYLRWMKAWTLLSSEILEVNNVCGMCWEWITTAEIWCYVRTKSTWKGW